MGPPFGTVDNDCLHGTGSECAVGKGFGFFKVNVLEELFSFKGFIVARALRWIRVGRVESGVGRGADFVLMD